MIEHQRQTWRTVVRVAWWALPILASWPCMGQAVIEGTVRLPKPASSAQAVRYAHLPIQPDPPDLPTAVVYLEGHFPADPAGSSRAVFTMGQTNLQFYPALLPI